MKTGKKELGIYGEKEAKNFLLRKGYEILHSNYRTRYGEIDIVAKENNTIVFVEVKTRKDNIYGEPYEAVNWEKQNRLMNLARAYIQTFFLTDYPVRFDVIAISPGGIEHIVSAFEPE